MPGAESLECEVLVVGSRIAGATIAALLGEAGRDVILVDRATFPSSTLSTHFFRGAMGVAALRRLGVLDEVLRLGSPKLACEYLYLDGSETPVPGPPQQPGDVGFSLSVRRQPLDHILVRRADREQTVRVLQGTRLVDIKRDGERINGAVLARSGDTVEVRSRFVVGADGRYSPVAAAVDPPLERRDRPVRAMYYQYVTGFPWPGPDPGPEFSLRGDQLAGVFPSDSGVTCVAVSVNLAAFKAVRQSPAASFPQVIAGHRGLAERFGNAKPVSRVFACGPHAHHVRRPVGPGWALAGDASIHLDPWNGFGIDFATTHAIFLAEALLAVLSGGQHEAEALKNYWTRRNEHGMATYQETIELAKDLRALTATDDQSPAATK
jgi:menaquinone-9 beta-reductase